MCLAAKAVTINQWIILQWYFCNCWSMVHVSIYKLEISSYGGGKDQAFTIG